MLPKRPPPSRPDYITRSATPFRPRHPTGPSASDPQVLTAVLDALRPFLPETMNRYEGVPCPQCRTGTVWVQGWVQEWSPGNPDTGQRLSITTECGCVLTYQEYQQCVRGETVDLRKRP